MRAVMKKKNAQKIHTTRDSEYLELGVLYEVVDDLEQKKRLCKGQRPSVETKTARWALRKWKLVYLFMFWRILDGGV